MSITLPTFLRTAPMCLICSCLSSISGGTQSSRYKTAICPREFYWILPGGISGMCLKPTSKEPGGHLEKSGLNLNFEFDSSLQMWNGDPGPDCEMGSPGGPALSSQTPWGQLQRIFASLPSRRPSPKLDLPASSQPCSSPCGPSGAVGVPVSEQPVQAPLQGRGRGV